MTELEKKIVNFVEKYYYIIAITLLLIMSVAIRYAGLKVESGDYKKFLVLWFDEMKGEGFKSLAHYPGDYNAPYMTIMAALTYLPIRSLYSIKLVSIFFDYVLAMAAAMLVRRVANIADAKKANTMCLFTFFAILFMPPVVLNSAFWGQCDVIYASFAILSLCMFLDKKYIWAFVLLGVAFAFKLQAVFLLPFYIIAYVRNKNFSILHFLLIPVVDVVLCIPALAFGMKASKIIKAYVEQGKEYNNGLTYNFPNFYASFASTEEPYVNMIFKAGLCLFIASMIVALWMFIVKNIRITSSNTVQVALLLITVITYITPRMHERYFIMGEILAMVYFIVYKRSPFVFFMACIIPLLTYTRFLFVKNISLINIAIVYLFIVLWVVTMLVKDIFGSNKDSADKV